MDISKQKELKYWWFLDEKMLFDFTGLPNIENKTSYGELLKKITEKQFWYAKNKAEQGIKVILQ